MNPHNAVNGDDEQFTLLLARYSEALTTGSDAAPTVDPALPAELRQRLRRALDCLRRLRQFLPRPAAADAATKIMEKDLTLHDDMVGKQIGRFHILGTLGSGGGGVVFLAYDPDLHREAALKVPHLSAMLAPDMRRRFLREARAAARLDHPNLVPVHEVGESDGVCYLVSAYCRGGSLADWLKQRTEPVPVRQAAELLVVLADAVQYVHEHGIYHRDIKPSNILLDHPCDISLSGGRKPPECAQGAYAPRSEANLSFTPRLTDFGLAKQLKCDSGQTASGTLLGTPSYMAPEQIECRSADIGPRTDVYGLGAVLYELLTGRPPFKGATDTETLALVLHEAPVRPRRLRSDVPRDLETICLKCLEKLPEHRYGSAAELAGELRRFLAGEPIQARPPGIAERSVKWMRRHPWAMIFACFVGLALLALLSGSHYFQARQRTLNANLAAAAKQREEQHQILRRQQQRLRQFQYADGIVRATRPWDKRRLDELADQLRIHIPPDGANGPDDPRGFEWYYLFTQASILRRRMRSPDSSLYCVAFSPDGTTCATGHEDGAIRLWDWAAGRMRQIVKGHKLPIYALAYSPDGKYLVSGGGINNDRRREGELRLWDTASLKLQFVFPNLSAGVNSLAFSPNGRTLAALAGRTAQLWEMPSRTLRTTIPFAGGVASVAFHADNATLAVGHVDGKISLHNAADGRRLAGWQGHQRNVWSLAYGRANGLLVTGGHGSAVRLWGPDLSRPVGEYRHNSEVWSVAISQDERMAASISRDGVVKLWDVGERREHVLLVMPSGWGRCVAFSADGKSLAVGSQTGQLWMCDLSHAAEAASWLGHQIGTLPCEAWAVAFSPDGKLLASAGDDHMIRLWDPASGRERAVLRGHQSLVTSLAFSPDGKLLASGSFDKKAQVKLWEAAGGKEIATLNGHNNRVDSVVFSPDGKILATSGRDRIVRLWDVATRTELPGLSRQWLDAPGHWIESLAFSPDGRTLALASNGQALFLWDMQEQKLHRSLPPHPPRHVAVAFSPDGKTLVTGDYEGTLRFFDAATGDLRLSVRSHTDAVNCLAFSPDGKTLASAGFDKRVKLWQVSTGRELLTLPEQRDRVRWLAFSPDGAMLATAGHDGILKIYRADKTEPRPGER